jgi:hypothetical protein
MSNPSTVWTQLSLPNSPVGSIPFVYIDGTTVLTDVLNLYYTQTGDPSITGSRFANQLTCLNGLRVGFSDTTGVPGAATINKVAGRVKFAAAATTLVVTNSLVTATSMIDVRLEGAADATATRAFVSAQAAGSFTISLNAAATAAVTCSFNVHNVY